MDAILPFLPPLIVFFLGVLTHRIILSLGVGVTTAALIATKGSIIASIVIIGKQLIMNCEAEKWTSWTSFTCTNKLFIVGFIFASGALFTLVKNADGIGALVKLTSKRIKSARGAETTSLLLSHSLFIDGSLSSLTVSSIMTPISERFKIPKVKTALLADSMSGPLVVICPFSCFTALIIGLLSNNGVHSILEPRTLLHENPNSIYFLTLPYILYSLTIIATLWLIVRLRISLGVMKQYENNKNESAAPSHDIVSSGAIADFFIPIILFPVFIVFYVLLMDKKSSSIWQMLTTTPISFVLFASISSALICSVLYFRMRGRFQLKESGHIILSSFKSGLASVVVIVLAWTLADILKDNLKLGKEISYLISGSISISLLPLICFWMSSFVSASLGTAWGTVAIFVPLIAPTVIAMHGMEPPVTLEQIPILLPTLGAVISGAAFGDHVSLLSDSTVLSSTGAKCHPIDHFKTQWFYAVPVYIASSVGFLTAGLMVKAPSVLSYLLPLILSVTLSLSFVSFLHFNQKTITSDGKNPF